MAKGSTKAELLELLDAQTVVIRRAFKLFLKTLRSEAVLKRLLARFRARDVAGAVAIVEQHVERFADVLDDVFVDAAKKEIKRINRSLKAEKTSIVQVAFDPGNERAAKLMRRNRLRFIKDFKDSQRKLVRRVLTESLRAGENPVDAARRFKNAIGLTHNQQAAVDRYQRSLERGSREALRRTLRDRRFDRTLESTLDEGGVLDSRQIERMVGRYTEKMLQYRANTIARTESMRAVSQARHESWFQTLMQLDLDEDEVTRTWIATDDDRTRDSHADMDEQTVVGMDTPFISGDGWELMYPGDPLAPAEEICNCRCAVVFNTDF